MSNPSVKLSAATHYETADSLRSTSAPSITSQQAVLRSMTDGTRLSTWALLAAGVICTGLALYQDAKTRQLAADRDAALKRCEVALNRLQCQRIAENDYAETYPTQMVRAGAFQIAGVMLIGFGIATWLIRVKQK